MRIVSLFHVLYSLGRVHYFEEASLHLFFKLLIPRGPSGTCLIMQYRSALSLFFWFCCPYDCFFLYIYDPKIIVKKRQKESIIQWTQARHHVATWLLLFGANASKSHHFLSLFSYFPLPLSCLSPFSSLFHSILSRFFHFLP